MGRISAPERVIRALARAGAAGSVVAAAAVGALSLSPACGGVVHPPAVLDCSAEGSYDVVERYSLGVFPTWYGYGDTTPGAVETQTLPDGGTTLPWTQTIENGGRCGSQVALVLQSSRHQDYGSGFGDYNIGSLQVPCFVDGGDGGEVNCPYNASGHQGIAFWARSPGNHTKSVTIELADAQSYDSLGNATTCLYETNVIDGGEAGLPGAVTTVTVSVTGATGVGTTTTGGNGQQVPPGSCGNNFLYPLVVSDEWQLYEIPFSAFYQIASPNKEPRGFDPSTFFWLGVIVPKEANLELWIDELGFYPKKQAGG